MKLTRNPESNTLILSDDELNLISHLLERSAKRVKGKVKDNLSEKMFLSIIDDL